jgi:hypothetical protein
VDINKVPAVTVNDVEPTSSATNCTTLALVITIGESKTLFRMLVIELLCPSLIKIDWLHEQLRTTYGKRPSKLR